LVSFPFSHSFSLSSLLFKYSEIQHDDQIVMLVKSHSQTG
jgi:hypothetical protein